jgi:hypothetical protein
VTLSSKPAPVVHVIDSDLYKPPSTALSHATQVTTLAGGYSLRGASIANGIRQTVALSSGHVFTSSAGQPRMYSEGEQIKILMLK